MSSRAQTGSLTQRRSSWQARVKKCSRTQCLQPADAYCKDVAVTSCPQRRSIWRWPCHPTSSRHDSSRHDSCRSLRDSNQITAFQHAIGSTTPELTLRARNLLTRDGRLTVAGYLQQDFAVVDSKQAAGPGYISRFPPMTTVRSGGRWKTLVRLAALAESHRNSFLRHAGSEGMSPSVSRNEDRK